MAMWCLLPQSRESLVCDPKERCFQTIMFQDPCEISGMYINQPTRVVCLCEARLVFPVGVWCFSALCDFSNSGEFDTPLKDSRMERAEGFCCLMYLQLKVWHKTELGSGFNYVLFSPLLWGRWTHFDSYFLIGLKPPSREYLKLTLLNWLKV